VDDQGRELIEVVSQKVKASFYPRRIFRHRSLSPVTRFCPAFSFRWDKKHRVFPGGWCDSIATDPRWRLDRLRLIHRRFGGIKGRRAICHRLPSRMESPLKFAYQPESHLTKTAPLLCKSDLSPFEVEIEQADVEVWRFIGFD